MKKGLKSRKVIVSCFCTAILFTGVYVHMNDFPHLMAKETQESEASMMGEIEAADEKQTIDEIMGEVTLSDEQTVSPANMQVAAFSDFTGIVTNPPLDTSVFGSTTPGVSKNSDKEYFQANEYHESDFLESEIARVTTEAQMTAAFTNRNIKFISIEADFVFTSGTSNGPTSGMGNGGNDQNTSIAASNLTNRTLIIEGNDHVIDSRSRSYFFAATSTFELHVQNLTVFAGNWYGPFSSRGGKQVFHNFTNIGTQMLNAPSTDVTLSGDITNYYVESYVSPLDPSVTWYPRNYEQANFEISNLTMLPGATFYGNQRSAGGFQIAGKMTMQRGSEVILDSRNATLVNFGEADGSAIRITGSGNGLYMEDDARLDILGGKVRNNHSSISINTSGSFFEIGNNAQVNIVQDGHTSNTNGQNRNVIYLAGNSRFLVREGGSLNVKSLNNGTSTSHIINAAQGATFTVEPRGSFHLESDSTGNHSLIYFGGNGTFRFEDALSVNLQFNNVPNDAASLIYMNGTGSGREWRVDVQRVKGWKRGSNILNNDTPDYDWTPMFGMTIPYANQYIRRNTMLARSVNSSVLEDFYRNFETGPATNSNTSYNVLPSTYGGGAVTTYGFQRLEFEFIPDVVINIEEVNDLVTDSKSRTVTGTVNPNAYVRIWDVPVSGSSRSAVMTDTEIYQIDSPVELNPGDVGDETTDQYTVQADANGKYIYTLPEGKYFDAGSTIHAYAFKEGKSDTAETIVLDKTPPTGDPVEYHTAVGELPPTADKFIVNPADTNPITPTFGYEFAEENSAEQIAAMMNTQGVYDVYVYLLDNAVDSSGNPAPNKTKIKATLNVHETLDFIEADAVSAKASEINSLTEAQLKTFILNKSNANASTLIDGVPQDLTDKIKITEMNGLTPTTTEGIFNVVLTVSQSDSGLTRDLTKTIQVFIYDDHTAISPDEKYALRAVDFTVASKDYPTSAEEILAMIRTKGALNLKQLLPAPAVDLPATDIEIDVSNLPPARTAGNVTPAGEYNVKLSYGSGESLVEKTIKVTITQSEATLRVRFVDADNQDIVEALEIDVLSGQNYNLTDDEAVKQKIIDAQGKYYDLVSSPENASAYPIDQTVTEAVYTFSGKLTISSIPQMLNFKTQSVSGTTIRENSPTFTEPLKIADTRSGSSKSWTLKAALSKQLTSEDDSIIIPDAIRYKRTAGSDEFALNGNAQVIESTNNSTEKSYDISSTWGTTAESPGFKLEIPAVKVAQLGKYSAEITYTLSDTYEP